MRVPLAAAAVLPAGGVVSRQSDHPRCTIVREGQSTPAFVAPVAPNDDRASGLAPTYDRVGEYDRDPGLQRTAEYLHYHELNLLLVHRDAGRTVETQLKELRALARMPERLRINLGPSELGWWRIDRFGWQVLRRGPRNVIIEAEADIQLVRAWYPAPGWRPPVVIAKTPQAGTTPIQTTPVSRTHTVAAGDTLWTISQRAYGTTVRWQDIARVNGVTDPRKLRVGQILRLP